MGEAKRRGTRAERIAQSQAKKSSRNVKLVLNSVAFEEFESDCIFVEIPSPDNEKARQLARDLKALVHSDSGRGHGLQKMFLTAYDENGLEMVRTTTQGPHAYMSVASLYEKHLGKESYEDIASALSSCTKYPFDHIYLHKNVIMGGGETEIIELPNERELAIIADRHARITSDKAQDEVVKIEDMVRTSVAMAESHASECKKQLDKHGLRSALEQCEKYGVQPPTCSLTAASPNAENLRQKASRLITTKRWWELRLKEKALRDYEDDQYRQAKITDYISDGMRAYMTKYPKGQRI